MNGKKLTKETFAGILTAIIALIVLSVLPHITTQSEPTKNESINNYHYSNSSVGNDTISVSYTLNGIRTINRRITKSDWNKFNQDPINADIKDIVIALNGTGGIIQSENGIINIAP